MAKKLYESEKIAKALRNNTGAQYEKSRESITPILRRMAEIAGCPFPESPDEQKAMCLYAMYTHDFMCAIDQADKLRTIVEYGNEQ